MGNFGVVPLLHSVRGKSHYGSKGPRLPALNTYTGDTNNTLKVNFGKPLSRQPQRYAQSRDYTRPRKTNKENLLILVTIHLNNLFAHSYSVTPSGF